MAEPAPKQPMRDPRGWLLFLAIAAAIAMFAFNRGGKVKSGPNLQCLTHSDCARALRCYAVPKDDPFATFGVCVEPCLDDAQCGPGARCAVTARGNEQLLPVKPGLEPGERVCLR
ncbi:MAG: hypothetical protein H6Q89_931 [Myxococcaceae bacterium]|nr:hypothetical protein [Myxococcaceae bacterium]